MYVYTFCDLQIPQKQQQLLGQEKMILNGSVSLLNNMKRFGKIQQVFPKEG